MTDTAETVDVVGLGVIAVDILMQTPGLPEEGSKTYASGALLQGAGWWLRRWSR